MSESMAAGIFDIEKWKSVKIKNVREREKVKVVYVWWASDSVVGFWLLFVFDFLRAVIVCDLWIRVWGLKDGEKSAKFHVLSASSCQAKFRCGIACGAFGSEAS